jgi:hypothetical protein
VLALALVLCAGCRRSAPDASKSAPEPSAVASAAIVPSELTSLVPAIASADLRVEARRGTLLGPDALLQRHAKELTAHFGDAVPYPLAFQVVSAGAGRSAVLLLATQGEARPLVWLLDAAGDIVWAKAHPIGGVKPGVSEPTLAPGPDGHVCLAWCNGSTDSIAFRRWADDGGAFADYDALHVDGCDSLSVLYWPGRGWVLAVAMRGKAVLERLDENGERRWGNDGIALPWTWPSAAPVALALDTPDTLLLFRLGQSGGEGTGQYVFASRWSHEGRTLWPGPLSVRRLPGPVRDPLARVVLEPGTDGAIRASLPSSALGAASSAVTVEVASDGSVVRR